MSDDLEDAAQEDFESRFADVQAALVGSHPATELGILTTLLAQWVTQWRVEDFPAAREDAFGALGDAIKNIVVERCDA